MSEISRIDLLEASNKGFQEQLSASAARIAQLEHSERLAAQDLTRMAKELEFLKSGAIASINSSRYEEFFPSIRAQRILEIFSVQQRRELWLTLLGKLKAPELFYSLSPHDSSNDLLNILVRATGGYGDFLYATTIIRELHHAFPASRIIVVSDGSAIAEVLKDNPFVYCLARFTPGGLHDFLEVGMTVDVFDLVVEVRYAASLAFPTNSRLRDAFPLAQITEVNAFQNFIRAGWPYRNNELAREARNQGLAKLDLLGKTSGLPISQDSELDFFFQSFNSSIFDQIPFQRYVTVHHGADLAMGGQSGVQTKNVSVRLWEKIVAQLAECGIPTIQLGASHEEGIHGVDLDLRGQTSFEATALVQKYALAHIDTEGGLVHLARAMQTRSVVMFGPTPSDFFGYPANKNIDAQECGNCWWLTKTWATQCPRGMTPPPCMESHTADEVVAALKSLPTRSRSFQSTVTHARTLEATLAHARDAARGKRALLVALDFESACFCAGYPSLTEDFKILAVPADYFDSMSSRMQQSRVLPFAGPHFNLNPGGFEFCALISTQSDENHSPSPIDYRPYIDEAGRLMVEKGGDVLLLQLPNRWIADTGDIRIARPASAKKTVHSHIADRFSNIPLPARGHRSDVSSITRYVVSSTPGLLGDCTQGGVSVHPMNFVRSVLGLSRAKR